MKYTNIIATTIFGFSTIVALNFDKIQYYSEYFILEVKNSISDNEDAFNDSPYLGSNEAFEASRKQEVIGQAWEDFLLENKTSKNIKIISNSKWGDYMCYPNNLTDNNLDDKYADKFIEYLKKNKTLERLDWNYEDLSTPIMYSVHPYGRGSLEDMNPAVIDCKKPIQLYRINRYKRKLS